MNQKLAGEPSHIGKSRMAAVIGIHWHVDKWMKVCVSEWNKPAPNKKKTVPTPMRLMFIMKDTKALPKKIMRFVVAFIFYLPHP